MVPPHDGSHLLQPLDTYLSCFTKRFSFVKWIMCRLQIPSRLIMMLRMYYNAIVLLRRILRRVES